MTGPEHYRESERLLAELTKATADVQEFADTGRTLPDHEAEAFRAAATNTLARAQVHATLALAAATGLGLRGETQNEFGGMRGKYANEWADVAGGQR